MKKQLEMEMIDFRQQKITEYVLKSDVDGSILQCLIRVKNVNSENTEKKRQIIETDDFNAAWKALTDSFNKNGPEALHITIDPRIKYKGTRKFEKIPYGPLSEDFSKHPFVPSIGKQRDFDYFDNNCLLEKKDSSIAHTAVKFSVVPYAEYDEKILEIRYEESDKHKQCLASYKWCLSTNGIVAVSYLWAINDDQFTMFSMKEDGKRALILGNGKKSEHIKIVNKGYPESNAVKAIIIDPHYKNIDNLSEKDRDFYSDYELSWASWMKCHMELTDKTKNIKEITPKAYYKLMNVFLKKKQ